MAVNKKLKRIYFGFFDGIETMVVNAISDFQQRHLLRRYLKTAPDRPFANQVTQYWRKWKRISPKWAWYYASRNGIMDPRYIPNDLYNAKIDQHFNNRKLGWGFNDKNYYSKIFQGIRQPKTLVRNIGGLLEDENYNILTLEESYSIIGRYREVICKPSLDTGSGQGILFWNVEKDKDDIVHFIQNKCNEDWIVQEIIEQHQDLCRIYDKSVNTVRIVSLLMPDGVYILSSVLRMGANDLRVDNGSAGGVSCGIKEDGCLKEFGTILYSGIQIDRHPQGFLFKGFKVPGYDKALNLVKKAHPIIPHFRLVSWDVAIGKDGEPILIEANMRKGGIAINQFNNGPLFGDLTEKVLNEVFGI